MKKQFLNPLLFLCLFTIVPVNAQQKPWIDFNRNGKMDVYENPDSEIDKRVNDLLSQMTVYEKMKLLHSLAPAIPRLGISKYYHGNEALHGVVRPGKFTVYPQAIAFAATFNPDLIYEVATTISDEARARWNELDQGEKQTANFSDLLTFWSPTVNMARDPRWGRTPETYGEDPCLTSRTGVAFVKGLQGDDPRYLKVVSTPKHFAANNEEHNRFECNAIMSERSLRSYYLPGFKACITEGKAQSIMSAFNAINGVPCTANKFLLTDILRNEWGFNGYIVADCGAPQFLFSRHKYAPTIIDAVAMSIKAGLDLECGDIFPANLPKAYESGKLTESEVNNAAFRVLRARFKLGLFDDPVLNPYTKIPPSVIGCEKHQKLALETSRQSIVLLKNENNILPVKLDKIKKIAVLGINANSSEFGDYSGYPINKPVSPYQGIVNKVGKRAQVKTILWLGKLTRFEIVPSKYLDQDYDIQTKNGLKAEYFDNPRLEGTPGIRVDKQIFLDPVNQPPDPLIKPTGISVRWTGKLVPGITGSYYLGIKSEGGIRLYLNNKLLFNRWGQRSANDTAKLMLIAGQTYALKVEYCNRLESEVFVSLMWKTPEMKDADMYSSEKSLARSSDIVIAVLGINKSIEMEGLDRTTLELPADQMQFIKEIYKVNPRTIVVLVAGSSLAINWIQENVPAIVNAWYPGEQGGNAIADVLFGDYNPAGRLPLTYYKSLDDLPAFNDYEIFNGRTYLYFEKKPLYPFGFGLSYTSFEYTNIRVAKKTITPGESVEVSIDVKNTGKYDGDEVVQLYLKDVEASEKIPIKQLKAFKRIILKIGEVQTVTFKLDRNDLSFWNSKNEFILEPGTFDIMIGASSDDIRQQTSFEVIQ